MEQSLFITDIKINELRHLKNITIPLSKTERKNLIITGKNGSGKTSLLQQINTVLCTENSSLRTFYNYVDKVNTLDRVNHKPLIDLVNHLGKAYPISSIDNGFASFAELDNFVYACFEAKRTSNITMPKGINKVEFVEGISAKRNAHFLQYIVNLKAEKSFANDDKDLTTVAKIDAWFANFEDKLRKIFNDSSLQLIFDRKDYSFYFKSHDSKQFGFNELSDGYSAVIDILTELILKVEATNSKTYDVQGIVLIDEIETHLHLELQQVILPLLTSFFPNIQFIVTTHSPVVLASLENVVIYDLENKIATEDYSDLSYGAIAKYYFNISRDEAIKLKTALSEFEKLIKRKNELSEDEQDTLLEIDTKFRRLGPLFAPEEFNKYLDLRKGLSK